MAFYGGQPLLHPGAHLLGTDLLGRDVVYRTLKGARVALLIGGLTSLVVIPIALLFGVTAGYFGRRIDDAVFFAMTVLASVPSLLLLIALIMVLGKGTVQVCVALGVTGWVHFCRIARGETLKLREADFVAAARALGVSRRHASSGATSCPTSPISSSSPSRCRSRRWCCRRPSCPISASGSTAAGAR